MKEIKLTRGKTAIVDDVDYATLNQHKWYADKGYHTYYGRRRLSGSGSEQQFILMHRAILNASDGVQVDHVNGSGLDNRRSNLRLCTHAENCRHRQSYHRTITGFKGVTIRKDLMRNPFVAYIRVDNKTIHIGCYQTAEAAAKAYDLAAVKYHGQFAVTNEMLGVVS